MATLDRIVKKILNCDELKEVLKQWKYEQKKIVFTNGCFDLIHRGHIDYLAKSADLGEVLIIGLNSDNSVKRIKGQNRPIIDEYSRALLLASLEFVSAVVLFDEDTPYDLVSTIKPDVLVKGSDYKAEDIVGNDVVKSKGGQVVTLSYLPGFSTSSIVQKIRQ